MDNYAGVEGCKEERQLKFYKNFYDENYANLLMYKNLRKHFQRLVEEILGDDYYNMAQDTYDCDRMTCEDIAVRAKNVWYIIFNRKNKKRKYFS